MFIKKNNNYKKTQWHKQPHKAHIHRKGDKKQKAHKAFCFARAPDTRQKQKAQKATKGTKSHKNTQDTKTHTKKTDTDIDTDSTKAQDKHQFIFIYLLHTFFF